MFANRKESFLIKYVSALQIGIKIDPKYIKSIIHQAKSSNQTKFRNQTKFKNQINSTQTKLNSNTIQQNKSKTNKMNSNKINNKVVSQRKEKKKNDNKVIAKNGDDGNKWKKIDMKKGRSLGQQKQVDIHNQSINQKQVDISVLKQGLIEQENKFQGIFGLGLFRNKTQTNYLSNFMNILIIVQILDRHDSKDRKMETSLILHQGSLSQYEDSSIVKYKSSYSNINGKMQLMLSKFGVDCDQYPNEDFLKTNIELTFSFNTKNVQVSEDQFLLVAHYLKKMYDIDCKMGNTYISCENIDDVKQFKDNRLVYWIAEHDETDPIQIRFEHIVDQCYNGVYEITNRNLAQTKGTSSINDLQKQYNNEETEFKKRENKPKKQSRTKTAMTCILNMNVQSAMNGQLIIGIPVLENKRIIFDKRENLIAIGPAKSTFSLFKIAKNSIKSFMKIFSSKPKKQMMQYNETEQTQNEGTIYEQSKVEEDQGIVVNRIIMLVILMILVIAVIYQIMKRKIKRMFQSDMDPFMNQNKQQSIQEMELQNAGATQQNAGDFQTDIENMMRTRLEFNNQNQYQVVGNQQSDNQNVKKEI